MVKSEDATSPGSQSGSLVLLVNTIPTTGVVFRTEEDVAAPHIARMLAKEGSRLVDLRAATPSSSTGYSKWQGYLAAALKAEPPRGYVTVNTSTTIGAIMLEALLPLADVVIVPLG